MTRRLRITRPLRLAVQTAGGAAMAFAAAKGLGIPDVSWVMFSAVFVVHSSLGGIIRSAVSGMAGGGADLLIGLIGISCLEAAGGRPSQDLSGVWPPCRCCQPYGRH